MRIFIYPIRNKLKTLEGRVENALKMKWGNRKIEQRDRKIEWSKKKNETTRKEKDNKKFLILIFLKYNFFNSLKSN